MNLLRQHGVATAATPALSLVRQLVARRSAVSASRAGKCFSTSLKNEHAISPDLAILKRRLLKSAMPSVIQSQNGVVVKNGLVNGNGLANGVRSLSVSATKKEATSITNGSSNGHAAVIASSDYEVEQYSAIVIGAGPGGLAALGKLIDAGVSPIAWVDPKFSGGRLNARYREVPSNTKVKLFCSFADTVGAFKEVVEAPKSKNDPTSPWNCLKGMDQETGCEISAAADLVLQLTLGMARNEHVALKFGKATELILDTDTASWEVAITPAEPERGVVDAKAPLVVLATGSAPIIPALPSKFPGVEPLDLDIALTPSLLAHYLPTDKEETIALVGASHSAILVLRNLYTLAMSSHPKLRVKWFSRHSLRYAEDRGDWILRDNTGLKGETAIWARQNLEGEGWDNGDVKSVVEKIFIAGREEEEAAYEKHLGPDAAQLVTRVCEAIGFKQSALPSLSLRKTGEDGEIWRRDVGAVHGDGRTGQIVEVTRKGEKALPGLRGIGIAWPERVTDPEGNVESAVGMWKFMKYLTKVVPEWAKDAGVKN